MKYKYDDPHYIPTSLFDMSNYIIHNLDKCMEFSHTLLDDSEWKEIARGEIKAFLFIKERLCELNGRLITVPVKRKEDN